MALGRTRRACVCLLGGVAGCQLAFGEYHGGHAAAGAAGAGTSGAGGRTASSGGSDATGGFPSDCDGTIAHRCVEGALQACNAGVWTTLQTCARPALCQPDAGVCDVCAENERRCDGSVLGVCNPEHTGFTTLDTCSGTLYCDVTADHCVACATNQAQCNANGDYVDVCNSQRTGWTLRAQSCNGLGCQIVDGRSDYCIVCTAANPPVCVPPKTLRTCVSGKWRATECPTGCADATSTTPAACY